MFDSDDDMDVYGDGLMEEALFGPDPPADDGSDGGSRGEEDSEGGSDDDDDALAALPSSVTVVANFTADALSAEAARERKREASRHAASVSSDAQRALEAAKEKQIHTQSKRRAAEAAARDAEANPREQLPPTTDLQVGDRAQVSSPGSWYHGQVGNVGIFHGKHAILHLPGGRVELIALSDLKPWPGHAGGGQRLQRPQVGSQVQILPALGPGRVTPLVTPRFAGQIGRVICDDGSRVPFEVKFASGEVCWYELTQVKLLDPASPSTAAADLANQPLPGGFCRGDRVRRKAASPANPAASVLSAASSVPGIVTGCTDSGLLTVRFSNPGFPGNPFGRSASSADWGLYGWPQAASNHSASRVETLPPEMLCTEADWHHNAVKACILEEAALAADVARKQKVYGEAQEKAQAALQQLSAADQSWSKACRALTKAQSKAHFTAVATSVRFAPGVPRPAVWRDLAKSVAYAWCLQVGRSGGAKDALGAVLPIGDAAVLARAVSSNEAAAEARGGRGTHYLSAKGQPLRPLHGKRATAVPVAVKPKLAREVVKKAKAKAAPPDPLHSFALLKAALGAMDNVVLDPEVQAFFDGPETGIIRSKDVQVPKSLEGILRPYQRTGFQWLVNNARNGLGCILADDMGLGKTIQAIALLQYMKDSGQLQQPALVVVPMSLLATWRREIQRWAPALRVHTYHGHGRKLLSSAVRAAAGAAAEAAAPPPPPPPTGGAAAERAPPSRRRWGSSALLSEAPPPTAAATSSAATNAAAAAAAAAAAPPPPAETPKRRIVGKRSSAGGPTPPAAAAAAEAAAAAVAAPLAPAASSAAAVEAADAGKTVWWRCPVPCCLAGNSVIFREDPYRNQRKASHMKTMKHINAAAAAGLPASASAAAAAAAEASDGATSSTTAAASSSSAAASAAPSSSSSSLSLGGAASAAPSSSSSSLSLGGAVSSSAGTEEITPQKRPRAAARLKDDTADVFLTSYGTFQRDVEKLVAGQVFSCMVLDEAQHIKNYSTQVSKAVKRMAEEIGSVRVALSGTPVENRLADLHSQFEFILPGYLATSRAEFERDFGKPITLGKGNGPGAAEKQRLLQRMIQPFVLRRLKTDPAIAADLPEKVEQSYDCEPAAGQASLYKAVQESEFAGLAQAAAEGEAAGNNAGQAAFARHGRVLAMMHALREVCNHPATLKRQRWPASVPEERRPDRKTVDASGKCTVLQDILSGIIANGEKAIIFCQYLETIDMLEEQIKDRFNCVPLKFVGAMDGPAREQAVQDFQTKPEHSVMLLSLQAGGVGITLTAATHVIHFDRCYNPARENQATDRAHRIGQTKTVFVHRLVTRGTFEEKLAEIMAQRQHLSDITVQAGEGWIADLDDGQLRELFSLAGDGSGGAAPSSAAAGAPPAKRPRQAAAAA